MPLNLFNGIIECMIIQHCIISLFICGAVQGADLQILNKQGLEFFKEGDYQSAVATFTDALKHSPSDPAITNNYIASCRSLAAGYARTGDLEAAIEVLREASGKVPENRDVRTDLVVVYINKGTRELHSKNISGAKMAIGEALKLDNRSAGANCLAGDIAYAMHDLDAAETYWKKARQADPGYCAVSNRITKLQNEKNTQRSYSRAGAYHFDIRFDYKTLGLGICDLREFLMEAYEKVGQDFDRFPQYPIVVILSSEDDFRMVNKVPDFVAGLYDGKIRVPVNFSKVPMSTLKAIIFHEYTHALIYDIAGHACPIWLNEGIAMLQMRTTDLVAVNLLRKALLSGDVISLEKLDDRTGIWNNPAYVNLAYAQSWIMAQYLFTRWNYRQIKNVLVRLKNGASFTAIIGEDMNRTPAQFEQEWKTFALHRIQ